MDVDASTIKSGQGRCCHKIIKEQKMNDNTKCRRTAISPVNVMAINDVNVDAITDKIMSVVETTLFEELNKSGESVDSGYGEEVVKCLVSRLYSLDIFGVKYSDSNKRPRTESREDAGSGGSDIIVTSFDNTEKSLDGAGLGGDADIIGTEDCDMSTDADTNGDNLTSNMAVDEESDKNHTAVNNNMPQEKLDNVGSEDVLDASLATTGKL